MAWIHERFATIARGPLYLNIKPQKHDVFPEHAPNLKTYAWSDF